MKLTKIIFVALIALISNTNAVAVTIHPTMSIQSMLQLDAARLVAPTGTTVIFVDIDFTLMVPSQLFLRLSEANRKEVLDTFFSGAVSDPKHSLHKHTIAFWNYLHDDKSMQDQILECSSVDLLKELFDRGAIIIGLTSRSATVASDTESSLRNLGIDFSQLSRLGDHQAQFEKNALLKNGIVYTRARQAKAIYIPQIIGYLNEQFELTAPFTAYHIDDSDAEIAVYNNLSLTSLEPLSVTPIDYRYRRLIQQVLNASRPLIFAEIAQSYSRFAFSKNSFVEKSRDN